MNDQILVRYRYRRANVGKNPPSFGRGCLMLLDPLEHRQAIDIFHDDIGRSVFGCAAVVKLGDIRMLEAGERLPFAFEAFDERFGQQAGFDDLDGGDMDEIAGLAFSAIHGPHAAAPDTRYDPVRADAFRGLFFIERVGRGSRSQHRITVGVANGLDTAGQFRPVPRAVCDPRVAFVLRNVQHLLEQRQGLPLQSGISHGHGPFRTQCVAASAKSLAYHPPIASRYRRGFRCNRHVFTCLGLRGQMGDYILPRRAGIPHAVRHKMMKLIVAGRLITRRHRLNALAIPGPISPATWAGHIRPRVLCRSPATKGASHSSRSSRQSKAKGARSSSVRHSVDRVPCPPV